MEPAIKKAESKLEYLSSDEETMSIYYAREKSLHDQANMVNSAEQRGREQGLQEGREQGLQQGREVEKFNVARKMLLAGMDIELIGSVTDLSIEEIKNLKNTI